MRVELKGRKITYLFNDRVIGFETDNLVDTFSCVVDVPGNYKLDVESKQDGCIYHNTISLNYNDELGEYYYIFTAGQLPVGKCLFQLRRINDDKVFLSDKWAIVLLIKRKGHSLLNFIKLKVIWMNYINIHLFQIVQDTGSYGIAKRKSMKLAIYQFQVKLRLQQGTD